MSRSAIPLNADSWPMGSSSGATPCPKVDRSWSSVRSKLARSEFRGPIGGLVIATGQTFPDAVAAGAAGFPVLLVPSTGPAPQVVTDALAALAPLGIIVMGGSRAVSDATLDSLGL